MKNWKTLWLIMSLVGVLFLAACGMGNDSPTADDMKEEEMMEEDKEDSMGEGEMKEDMDMEDSMGEGEMKEDTDMEDSMGEGEMKEDMDMEEDMDEDK